MACTDVRSLRDHAANAPRAAFFFDNAADVLFTALDRRTSLGGRLGEFDGRSVLVATASQLTAALALIELDGLARRIVILPPDAEADHLPAVIAAAEIDAVVLDSGSPRHPGIRSSRARRLRAVDRAAGADAGPAPSHRMGAADLRHDRRAEDGRARPRRAHRRHRRDKRGRWRRGLGHVLRHPPLRRPADFPPRGARRRLARPLERRRAGRRSSGAACAPRRHAHLRHAVALAPRADESGDPQHRAALRAALGRDRRPGDPRQPARSLSACRASATPMPRPKRASPSTSTTASPAFPPPSSALPATASR